MACMPWYKVHAGWTTHEKVLTLCALLNDDRADVYVGRLWDYCAQRRGDGCFTGAAAATMLERAVRYSGPAGSLADAMVTAGLLERGPEGLTVHDWAEEQAAIAAKFERDRARPHSRDRSTPDVGVPARGPRGNRTGSARGPHGVREVPAEFPPGESREKRVEKSQVREAQETTSRTRDDESAGRGPHPVEPATVSRQQPAWLQPATGGDGESLPDGICRVYREARGGAEYSWMTKRDDAATRELLARAGPGGTAEVLRRWGHGLRARFKQRCDTLPDLVQRWEANATPEDGGPSPPGKPKPRALNPADYREGDVDTL